MIKKVFVLVGLPGSGKSYWRANYAPFIEHAFVYSTDDYIESKIDGANIKTYNESFSKYVNEAQKEMDKLLEKAIKDNFSWFVWDQTNLTLKKRKKIVDFFQSSFGKEIKIICCCWLPPSDLEEKKIIEYRLADRPGKNIPSHILENMLETYKIPTFDEGFDRIVYYDLKGNIVSDLDINDKKVII
jgi:predicted kinase